MQRPDRNGERPEVLTETEARQAVHAGMYRVLAISISLAIIAGLILYLVFFPMWQSG